MIFLSLRTQSRKAGLTQGRAGVGVIGVGVIRAIGIIGVIGEAATPHGVPSTPLYSLFTIHSLRPIACFAAALQAR